MESNRLLLTTSSALLVTTGATLPALAQASAIPDYGYEWATITDPGNPDFNRPELWGQRLTHGGGVGYIYRMAETKVTNARWLEFLRAYAPHHDGRLDDIDVVGWDIDYGGVNPDGEHVFVLAEAKRNHAVTVSWFNAARYCNWLHNDQGNTAEDFLDGAYDTRDVHLYEDQLTDEPYGRRPGARFWIPSDDEWVKAMYWDPDHPDFPGGGYWYYPHGKDVPAVSGKPEDGGETNSGYAMFLAVPLHERDPYLNVGLYPDIRSPWGLLDGSGCRQEWTEYYNNNNYGIVRTRGSRAFAEAHEYVDSVDTRFSSDIIFTNGIRLASKANCTSDLAVPFGIFDLADISLFIESYLNQSDLADLAEPAGIWSVEDISVFINSFISMQCTE